MRLTALLESVQDELEEYKALRPLQPGPDEGAQQGALQPHSEETQGDAVSPTKWGAEPAFPSLEAAREDLASPSQGEGDAAAVRRYADYEGRIASLTSALSDALEREQELEIKLARTSHSGQYPSEGGAGNPPSGDTEARLAAAQGALSDALRREAELEGALLRQEERLEKVSNK